MLKLGADPKIKNKVGQTALHASILRLDQDEITLYVIKLLIKFGADIYEKDIQGNIPLFYALYLDCPNVLEVAKFLIAKGSNVEHKNNRGETYVNYLIQNPLKRNGIHGDIEVALELGCDINTKDVEGNTPLHNFIINPTCHDEFPSESIAAIELLITNGSKIDARNNEGKTPLHLLIDNLKNIVTDAALNCNEYGIINLQEFINLFAPSFIIRDNEGNRPYDIALALANTDDYRNNAQALNILLKVTALIKPS